MFNWDQKKVFITGGSKGIGFEIVKILLDKGAVVYTMSRTAPDYNHTNLICHRADLYNHIPRMNVEFDVIIMNIGANVGFRPFDDLEEEEIERNIFLNLNVHVLLAKRLKYKKIVFIDSILSFSGIPNSSLYCASKAFISSFNQSLRREGKDTYIVFPYKVNTGLFDEIKDFMTLDKQSVAQTVVSDIENNVKSRTIPFIFNIIPILEALLPISFADFLCKQIIKMFTKIKKD